ncbi:unnamed protein product [Calypogeia fissa]
MPICYDCVVLLGQLTQGPKQEFKELKSRAAP